MTITKEDYAMLNQMTELVALEDNVNIMTSAHIELIDLRLGLEVIHRFLIKLGLKNSTL